MSNTVNKPLNRAEGWQPLFACLGDLLAHYGQTAPERIAILAEGRTSLTYGALRSRTNEIIRQLRDVGIGVSDRVAVVLPGGPDAAVVMLGVAAGAVCVPLHSGFSSEELKRYLQDLQVAALLTRPDMDSASRGAAYSLGIPVIDMLPHPELIGGFKLICSAAGQAVEGELSAGSNDAFVLLTSGSTAQPKLVPLTHANVCRSAYNAGVALALEPGDRLINVLPLVHAHGLISGLLGALAAGSSVICLSAFDAAAFFRSLKSFQPTWYTAVPPIHRALISAARRRKRSVRPSSLRLIRSASLSLPTDVLDELESLFGVPVIETYGMTEAASQIAANPLARRKPGSVGKSAGAEIAIMDSEGRELPIGKRGEVVLKGPTITRGYYKNDGATRLSFRDGWFRTGDLGYLDAEGYLFLQGRIKKADVINRGGQKVSPAEVEQVLQSHPDVAQAVVFPVPHVRLGEDVAAAVVPRAGNTIELKKLRRFSSERLARFKVPGLIRILPAIPADADGKIIRSELASNLSITTPRSRVELDHLVSPRSHTEWRLATIWADLLGLNELGIDEDVFALGADSLTVAQFLSRLRRRFKVILSFKQIFDAPTVSALATLVESSKHEGISYDDWQEVTSESRGFQSLQQQRIHMLSRMDPITHKYHVMTAAVLSGPLDIAVFEASIATICERHETLRSIFSERLGEPFQKVTAVLPRVEHLGILSATDTKQPAAIKTQALELLQQPFDIEQVPPVKVQLLKLADHKHLLLIKHHHLITDGWSQRLFFEELEELYNAGSGGLPPNLPVISFQYRHFVEWQRAWLRTPVAKEQLDHWHRRLQGLTELPLRTDWPRPERWAGTGCRLLLKLSRRLSNKLRSLSRANDVTLFMTLLAAFQCLLCRYTHHSDVAVGSLIANRNHLEIERLIGMFANVIVLRTDLSGNPTFREVLRRVREVTLEAYRHQELPIEEILRTLRLPRSVDRNPLFRVMFILQKEPPKPFALRGLSICATEQDPGTSRSDLVLELIDKDGPLRGWLEYSNELFEADTIKRMAAHFRMLLESIVANPDDQISRLQLLPAVERKQVVVNWNRTQTKPSTFGNFVERFAKQVEHTPEGVAVSHGPVRLSYLELARRAASIASRLCRKRLRRNDIVVLFAERGVDFLSAIIAVQQAGGAFLPLDPTMPAKRLTKIIQHSSARFILATHQSEAALRPALSGLPRKERPRVLFLETLSAANGLRSLFSLRRAPANLACIIYTSGSTGAPKGAMIEQRGMFNHLLSKISDLKLSASDVVAQTSPQSFVIALWQFLAPLMVGARVHIYADEEAHDPMLLTQRMLREEITVLEIVPALLRTILQPFPRELAFRALGRLRALISTGESLAPDLCRDWFRHFPNVPLINAYGATECSDDVATNHLASTPTTLATVPIGRPIANTRLYVLDQNLQPMPIGIVGELYVGGVSVGRGYLNDPGQTSRSFLRDPFSGSRAARLYRTGDLARWRSDGMLECFGRIDHQVKIRGCRVEVEEIEHVLMEHPSIRSVAVIVRENSRGEPQLIAYLVAATDKSPDPDKLGNFVKTRLPAHMGPARYIFLDHLPLTTHGKLDRVTLAASGLEAGTTQDNFVAPRNSTEQLLANIWADLLELEEVGISSNFFDLGGHSLLAGRVLARVASAFDVSLPIRALFEASTVEALARRIETERAALVTEPRSESMQVKRDGGPAISVLQEQMLRMERELPGLPQFNLPYAYHLRGPLDVGALERSLIEVIRRHESFRTCFGWVNEGPAPLVLAAAASDVLTPLVVEDLSNAAPAEDKRARALLIKKAELRVAQEAWTPFDLTRAPLFRMHLLRLGPDDHILQLVMHHVTVDGWSVGLFFEEMADLYSEFTAGRQVRLHTQAIAFSDFAAWQRRWCATETATQQFIYWKDCLGAASPIFDIDEDAGKLLASPTAREDFHLSKDLIARLTVLSHSQGATPFMALLAAFKTMLYARTGRGDICVGTTMANRAQQWTERVVGPVENTTIIRSRLNPDLSFREILSRVRHSVLEAHARQDLPFETLVDRFAKEGQPDLASLVQVFFVFQNAILKPFALPRIAVQRFGGANSQGQLVLPIDSTCLAVVLEETPTGISGSCTYKVGLFTAYAVKRWIANYKETLAKTTAAPDKPLRLLVDPPLQNRRATTPQQT
jgi:amino acid adenylation domain-containing protein